MHDLWQFYLLILIIALQGLLLGLTNRRGKIIFLVLCYVELVFIAGFRAWNMGNDTLPYVRTFISIVDRWDIYGLYMEKGYIWYNRFLALFTSNPQSMLLVNALLITGAIFNLIRKYSVGLVLSVLLFVVLQFPGTMNIMRQYLAIAIVLTFFPFIIQRKFFFYMFGCLLAMLFHSSAVFAISLYFIYPLSFKFKYILWLLVSVIVVDIFLLPVIERFVALTGHYATYLDEIRLGETKIASFFKMGVHSATFLFCYISYHWFGESEDSHLNSPRVSFLLWCPLVACCLQFLSIYARNAERLTIYFSVFYLLSIPYFAHRYPKTLRVLVIFGLLGFFILYESVCLVYRPEWNYLLPFEFCFHT
ncbi:MAG: EpsG family protein [Elusimicrobiaceae bacterium]|nr:EpsG family protein [Elusimicrobiaceae bacterium]